MQKVSELEAQIYELRERYDSVLERRIEHLNVTGYFETAVPDQCDNPDYEMEALEDWIGELRQKLTALRPEEHHYGKVLTSAYADILGTKYSNHGDNGYYVCKECNGIFKHGTYTEEKKLTGRRDGESFERCLEHVGRIKDATIVLKKEDLNGI